MTTTSPRTWSTDNYPNPSVTSFTAKFNIFGRNIPVTLWYVEGASAANFTVRAGKTSDLSYTGSISMGTVQEMQNVLESRYIAGTLIY